MTVEIIAYIATVIGAFLIIANDIGNANTKRLKAGAILTNVGIIVLCGCMVETSVFGGLFVFPIFVAAVLMAIELLIVKSMEY